MIDSWVWVTGQHGKPSERRERDRLRHTADCRVLGRYTTLLQILSLSVEHSQQAVIPHPFLLVFSVPPTRFPFRPVGGFLPLVDPIRYRRTAVLLIPCKLWRVVGLLVHQQHLVLHRVGLSLTEHVFVVTTNYLLRHGLGPVQMFGSGVLVRRVGILCSLVLKLLFLELLVQLLNGSVGLFQLLLHFK